LGYLKYGASVDQIITQELSQTSILVKCIRAFLVLGISCTFPLQACRKIMMQVTHAWQFFPVVQIIDNVTLSHSLNEGMLLEDRQINVERATGTEGLRYKPRDTVMS
jgi:hypothetical protein